jgi:predicted Zn-dependent protease
MQLRRRQLLALLPFLFLASTSRGESAPLDAVAVYLVPLDDFPEALSSTLARSLQQSMGFRVKASLRLPPLRIDTLPGTNQLGAEILLQEAARASARLPEATPATYRVFLTLRDINLASANFRFVFSSHNKSLNCSVVSLARMLEYVNGKPSLGNLSTLRLLKMTKRAIGEMYLGWTRSTDPNDVMYSPLMSLQDLDRIGLDHAEGPRDDAPKPPTPKPPPNAV